MHVARWPLDDRREIWWSRRTGRHAIVEPGPMSPALEARLRRLDLLPGPPPDPARWIPVRGRLPLLREDALWHPVPGRRDAGGHPWTRRPLTAAERACWRAADGRRSGAEVAARAGVALSELEALWAWATAPEVQAGQWRAEPADPRDPGLVRLVAPPRENSPRDESMYAEDGRTDLTAWHLAIDDAPTHFDDVETTVAHAHALPHPALGGRRFGEALADALAPWDGPIVEVGCGTGDLCAALLSRAGVPAERYLRIDLSPALLGAQAARCPGTGGVLGDAVRLPLRDASVARLVCNEVIADLSAARGPTAEVRPLLDRAGLPARDTTYNLGALQLVAEIARVLAPGGRAYVSEFGGPDDEPEEAVQLDHPEVSIRFGDLVALARAYGLTARLVRLDELLGFDLGARQLARAHHEGLRAMCRAEGRTLPARAWTPEQLAAALPWPVEGLLWTPVSEPGAGPLVTRFWALIMERSESASRRATEGPDRADPSPDQGDRGAQ